MKFPTDQLGPSVAHPGPGPVAGRWAEALGKLVQASSSRAAWQNPGLRVAGALSAVSGRGQDLSGCQGAGPTDLDLPTALREEKGASRTPAQFTFLAYDPPHLPPTPRNFRQMIFTWSLQNGKAASISTGLDVAYLSPLKRGGGVWRDSNGQRGISSLL